MFLLRGMPIAMFYVLSEIVIALLLIWCVFRIKRLKKDRDNLLKEKDVIYGFVHDVGDIFANADQIDQEHLLKRVLFYALRTTRAAAGAIYLMDNETQILKNYAISGIFPPLCGLDAGLEHALSKSQHVENMVKNKTIKRGEGLIGTVADLGTPLLIEDAEPDSRVPHYNLDFLKVRSILIVPMRFQQEVLGVLAVVNRIDGLPFSESDQNLLQSLGDQASVSIHYAGLRQMIDEKHRIDNDLTIARQIQTNLLPKEIPRIDGVELAAFNHPALEIGGDYFDFIPIDDDHFGIAIADVSGKGIGGAIIMSACRSILRAQALGNPNPRDVLTSLNRVVSQDMPIDMFISVLYMVLNTKTLSLTIARAGHERPILSSLDRTQFTLLDPAGLAIGITDAETFETVLEETQIQLNPNDVIVAYTDGITEAMNLNDEEWGMDRFMDTIRVSAGEGANSVLNNVRERLVRFVGNRPQYDDMTLVSLRIMK